jgi:hypothetical protein
MECVIRIVAGPEAGQEFRCAGAEAVVGRSPRSAVRLTSPSVSYEHAVVLRGVGGEYYLENLSANGTYLNNERLAGRARLKTKDQFRVGDETVARVESLPAAAGGGGGSRRLLLGLLVALLVVGLAVVIIDPFSGGGRQNWRLAYGRLDDWARGEVENRRLPADTARLLEEAWRLESAGDREAAAKAWLRLRVLLASSEETRGYQGQPQALTRLMQEQAPAAATEDDMAAALVEFVARMAKRQ